MFQKSTVTRTLFHKVCLKWFPWRCVVSYLLWSSFWSPVGVTGSSVEPQRPLSVQRAQGPELQRHGVRAGARRILVLQSIVVVVFHRFTLRVVWEGPEAVQMDLITEASGHCVHEEPSGRTLDVDMVGEPVPVHRNIKYAFSCMR